MIKKTNKLLPLAVRIWTLVPVVILLLFASYLSFRWALADVLSTQVWHQLEKAQTTGQSLDAKHWTLSRTWLEKTLWLHPDYSGHLELAEFFYQVAGDQPTELLDELGWHDNHEKALDYARRALLIRPTWPYLWDELILNKVILNQFDNELTGAIERAVTLGPWEKSVQYDVAFTGLDYWDDLEIAARQWIMLAMNRTLFLQRDQQPLLKQILTHANFEKLCLSATEMPEDNVKMLANYCKRPFYD